MNSIVVEQFLPGFTSVQLSGTSNSSSVAPTSTTSPRHASGPSHASVWVMLGTILGCLTIMLGVILAAAGALS